MANNTNYRDLVLLNAATRVNSSNQLTKHATAQLYKWSATVPSAAPNGLSQFNWLDGTNNNYNGTDDWSTTIPDNPGTAGIRLYVAQVAVTAYVGTEASAVPYGSANISAISSNGSNGNNGTSGLNVATVLIYQRTASNTAPARPSAAATYTFATGAVTGLDNNWSSIIPSGTGAYLWVSTAVASASGATDSIAPTEWNAIQLLAQNGTSVTGPRGAGRHYVVGTSWNDTVASAACPGGPVLNDVVIISGTNFVMEKVYNGSAWIQQSNVYDGRLIVSGSILAAAIDTRGLTVRDNAGNIILDAGSGLRDAYVPLSARNSELLPTITDAKNTSFTSAKTWEFRNTLDGWTSMGGALATGADSIGFTSGGADPILFSPVVSVPGKVYDKVRARVRRAAGSGWQGTVYYTNANHADHGGYQKTLPIDPTIGGNWTIIEWDMTALTAGGTDWVDNTTTRIRIDLGTTAQDVFEIDWVSIGKYSAGPAQSEILNNQDSSVRAPEGGVLVGTNSDVAGALKIRLPQSWSDTMMKFTVDIYEYLTGYSCTLEIAGYNYSGGSGWHNATARVIGDSNVEYPVHFGHDGTRCCVWVGNANETWRYPQVRVRDFLAGYTNYTADKWATGWQLSFDTAAATNVTATVTDTLPGADWSKIPNRAGKPENNATFTSPSKGQALNDDPNLENANAWSMSPNISIATTGGLVGGSGTKFLSCSTGLDQKAYTRRMVAIDCNKVYNLTALFWATAGNNRNMYLFVDFYDYAGNLIGSTGWGGTHSGYTHGGQPPIDVWTRVGGFFGPGTGRGIPNNARNARVGVWFQYSDSGQTSQVTQGAMDVRIEEVTLVANAMTQLDAISSDNVLSKGEKPEVDRQWTTIYNEHTPIYNQASGLGLIAERDAYYSTVNALSSYLGGLSPAWNNFNVDTPIVGATFRTKFSDYYVAKQALLNAIATKIQSNAAAAQTAANTANTAIAAITSDSVLSKAEKPDLKLRWLACDDDKASLVPQAADLGVSSTTFVAAHTALSEYLTSIPNGWSNVTTDSTIVPATFEAKWLAYYNEKQKLINALAAKAATVSSWAGVTGAGRPADYATSDITLIGRNATVTGNSVSKNGDPNSWDSDVYSKDSFTGGAYASGRIVDTNTVVMLALNSDPTTDRSYTSLDYAIYNERGTLIVYESGVGIAQVGSVVTGDILAVLYDGSSIRYLKNGVVMHSRTAPPNLTLYLDIALHSLGPALDNVRFGPMSSNNWASVGGRPAEDAIRNSMIDLSWWKRGGVMNVSNTNSETTSLVMTGTDAGVTGIKGPKGVDDVVAYCKEQTLEYYDGSWNAGAGGGWNGWPIILDPTKTYRFVIPIRKISGTGSAYWGTGNVCGLNTTSLIDNPYFASASGLSTDRWYLFVGYIYPAGSTGNTHDSAGIWDCKIRKKLAGGSPQNYNFKPGDGAVVHRAYQYYANTGAEQAFGRPMVNLVDGTEPSLQEFFENPTLGVSIDGAITDSNAAGLVQISNLRIISSKLGNYSTPGTGGRMDFNDSAIKMFDGANSLMMRLGNSAA